MTELSSHKVTRCTPGNSIHVFVSQTLSHLLSYNYTFLLELKLHRLTFRTSSSHKRKCFSKFIFSQSNVELELLRLTNESSYRTNFIVSQTKVHLELHRLTDESASSSSHKRTRTSSSHKRKCISNFIVSQTKVHLELHRLTDESAS